MSALNVVQEALDQFGRQAGLEKKSGAWYSQREEVIAVADLQKSQYGPQYYSTRVSGSARWPRGAARPSVCERHRGRSFLPSDPCKDGQVHDLGVEPAVPA